MEVPVYPVPDNPGRSLGWHSKSCEDLRCGGQPGVLAALGEEVDVAAEDEPLPGLVDAPARILGT